MAITTLLDFGYPQTIIQNQVYALPSDGCHITSQAAIQWSNDGTTFAALTGADTLGVFTSAVFIRCTTGNTIVALKNS